jgi:hypothetical protein
MIEEQRGEFIYNALYTCSKKCCADMYAEISSQGMGGVAYEVLAGLHLLYNQPSFSDLLRIRMYQLLNELKLQTKQGDHKTRMRELTRRLKESIRVVHDGTFSTDYPNALGFMHQ